MHKRVFVFTIKYRTIAISSKENILQKTLEEKKKDILINNWLGR